ncbi:MAG: YiiX/YebB-like N1pC/P60 family cysteine hydrolase [Bacteroidetes bacterium]|nr:YiiX/YebB-like N1pC/P60 family cysteine hydrolase [Bacteroidota bacterium]
MNHTPFLIILLFNPFIRLANRIRWRFGRPYKCAGADAAAITPLLKPGMVILTHKDYELTNLFINGYWTHTAIVTSEDTVVEAISKGVVTKPLQTFISTVDDFLILRPRFCSHESMKSASEHVKQFVGFPYNFTFRPDEDSVYCSELIFRAYSRTPEWDTLARTSKEDVQEFYDGSILLPQSFSKSQLLWQHVRPVVNYPERVFPG